MPLKEFSPEYKVCESDKLGKRVDQFKQLLKALDSKDISEAELPTINQEIEKVNRANSKSDFVKQIKSSFARILKYAEKELNLVAKNHYRNTWLAIGMAAFGVPFGVVFGAALNNYGFIGVGLPIGLGLGIAIGSNKDKQASEQGRQLDVEI